MSEPAYQMLGKYRVVEEVGRGGFGTVYRAHDPDLDREVAIKVLDPLLMREPVWVQRFRREAQVIARLDHPHIVAVYEIGQTEQALYIVERLVTAGSLARRLAAEGALPWPEVVRLVDEMAGALDYAHAQGVIHRDLKAANVLLDPEHGAQLTDFGFARMVAESSLSLSVSGGVVGTPQYMAPEVWEGLPATAQTDVYALGCMVYEMVTGETLFRGDTTPSVMRAHFQPLVLPESWPEGAPPGMTDVLRLAVARMPAARYGRAGELADALRALPADPLAEPYAALQAAAAAKDWPRVRALARQIEAESPGYRDVAEMKHRALAEEERAARAAQDAARKASSVPPRSRTPSPGAEQGPAYPPGRRAQAIPAVTQQEPPAGGVVCPACGSASSGGARFCRVCGGALPEGSVPGAGSRGTTAERLAPRIQPADVSGGRVPVHSEPVFTQAQTRAMPAGTVVPSPAPYASRPAPADSAPAAYPAGTPIQSFIAARPAPPINAMAVLSLIMGLCSLGLIPVVGGVVAIWAGRKARAQMQAQPGQERGMAAATVGLLLGWWGTLGWLMGLVLYAIGAAAAFSSF